MLKIILAFWDVCIKAWNIKYEIWDVCFIKHEIWNMKYEMFVIKKYLHEILFALSNVLN